MSVLSRIAILTTCLSVQIIVNAQDLVKNSTSPDTTKVGIFINSIDELNYDEGSFSANFTIWRLNKAREFKDYYLYLPMNSIDLDTLVASPRLHDQTENVVIRHAGDTIFWDYYDMTGKFRHDFDVRTYPFETEELTMEFEGNMYYDHYVDLSVDQLQSGADTLKLNGWKVSKMKIFAVDRMYPTNFGSPGEKAGRVYSGFKVVIPIAREGWGLFCKLFIGVLVSFLIAFFSLRINITEADGRFGVCVGAIFAALANMYIVNSNLPLASRFTLMDGIHMVVIVVIVGLFYISTVSLKHYKAENLTKSQKIDRRAAWVSLGVFVIGLTSAFIYFLM
ncbi:MAG: hypothetical protein WDO14_24400 [Bacteroidota bacterium]